MRAPKGTQRRKARMRDKDGAFCAYECTAFARQVVKKISRPLKERNKKSREIEKNEKKTKGYSSHRLRERVLLEC